MLTSQIGAYQATAYTALQQRTDSTAAAQATAAKEAPEFKQSVNGLVTRSGPDETANTNSSKKRDAAAGQKTATRGQFVNIVA